jgi:hypothetical protein
MLLPKDRILGETMIRMVPAAQTAQNNLSDFDPNHSLSQVVLGSTALADPTVLDFDLDYFPADSDCSDLDLQLNSPADFQVASSPSDQKVCFSPSLTTDLDYCSLTMFSPEASKMSSGGHATPDISKPGNYQVLSPASYYVPSASPVSLAPSSPYSPASCRPNGQRFSSTDSTQTSSTSNSLNLKENLEEFAELRRTVQNQAPTSVLKRALEDPCMVPSGLMTSSPEDTKLASVLSLFMDELSEHVKKEIGTLCTLLNIDPDPTRWSRADVARWLRHKMQELNIPSASCQPVFQWAANFEGSGFVQITEEEFKARLPEGGDQVYSALDMWRNAAANSAGSNNTQRLQQEELYHVDDVLAMIDNEPPSFQPLTAPSGAQSPPDYSEIAKLRPPPPSFEDHMAATAASSHVQIVNAMPSIDELLQQQEPVGPPPPPYPGTLLQPPMSHGSSNQDMTEDEADEQEEMLAEPSQQPSACPPAQHTGGGPIRTGSSNIHLWQFVKELLNQAQHSGCIHWVDKEQGIFKIVDSVRVAELWGKRKNRPAMNFDKLSRSLRQYYKKGIMKKTSRPQRLVYQFCSPYHL